MSGLPPTFTMSTRLPDPHAQITQNPTTPNPTTPNPTTHEEAP